MMTLAELVKSAPRAILEIRSDPPAGPADEDVYIVGAAPTGAWVGHEDDVAVWDGDGEEWLYLAPVAPWLAYIVDLGQIYVYTGAAWRDAAGGGVTLADGANIAAGTVTGSQLGTAPAQKLGLWGVAPVVQPSGADQAVVALTSSAATISGLSVSDPPTQAEVQAIRDETAKVATDLANLSTLLHALRTAGVDFGSWKGGA